MMPTAISLFSGMGGDSLGMKLAGCDVIAYNELKKTFCDSHDANFPSCTLIRDGKVNNITKLKDEVFQALQADIVFAGFPCQGFSSAGKRQDNDPRNTLFREFLRVVRLVQPSMIIGENVKGLLTKRTNAELYIDIIRREFEALGYTMLIQVFKAENYVPQKRERLILLGIKPNPYGWVPSFPKSTTKYNLKDIVTYDMEGSISVPPIWFHGIPAECILTNLEDETGSTNPHPYLKLKREAVNVEYAGKTHYHLFSFGKRISPVHCEIVDIRQPCKTVISTYARQPRFFVPLKNKSGCFLRALLPVELKQIQGFPVDYLVKGSVSDQIIQIGNAVPPPLIQSIVSNILKKN
jgi:DNA (cytosine-5)-methyltransferase 1